ncbi:hypothetical protein BV898_14687 [Hypsibius exemplaris]|uniref:Uncharacterized protein n=1 Tax=Hypsibius exemplaris TaxID=2072580 RepID=A0A9X6N994_HYPEX|nr:hypothetical protein BV898_14687 [Hypsibius exemplaris]
MLLKVVLLLVALCTVGVHSAVHDCCMPGIKYCGAALNGVCQVIKLLQGYTVQKSDLYYCASNGVPYLTEICSVACITRRNPLDDYCI